MAEQNAVAIVQRAYEAFQRGDIQAVLDSMADNIEWESPAVTGVPFGGRRVGKSAVAEFFRLLAESEDIQLFEPREFIAQGERVAVLGRYRARVKSTGRTAETPWVHAFTVRNGKVTQFFELYDTAVAERAYQQTASA